MERTMRCVLVSLIFCSCGDEDRKSDGNFYSDLMPDPAFPGTPDDEAKFASLFQYQDLPECLPKNAMNLSLRTELRIFRGEGVDDAQLKRHLAGLARFYGHYGIDMFTRHPVIDLPLSHAMILNSGEIDAHVKEKTGFSLDAYPPEREDEVLDAAGEAIFYNLRQFLNVYGQPGRDAVNVLLLRQMVGGTVSADLGTLSGIAGLGLSPYLLASFPPTDGAAKLYQLLHLQGDFTPMAVIGADLVDAHLRFPDVVISHEVGHAYGLAHTTTTDNLMTQGLEDCFAVLESDQLTRVTEATSEVSQTVVTSRIEQLSLVSRMDELLAALRSPAH